MNGFWETEITYLKKVGPVRAEMLQKELGIRTFGDLLTFFPRKYVDRSQVSKISQLNGEEAYVTLIGKFTQLNTVEGKKGRGRLTATFYDGSGFLEINWFQGVKWLAKSLKLNEELALFGKPSRYGSKLSISHPEIDYLRQEDGGFLNQGIVPYYPSTDKLSRLGLDSRGLRTLVYILLEEGKMKIGENLPRSLETELSLLPRAQALIHIHFPKDYQSLREASRRLKFEELFFFQLLLARKRSSQKRKFAGPPFEVIGTHFNQFYKEFLPFELTGAQKRVLKEIRKDVSQEVQMNRLVQGDVGSGKTMVAFMTMLMAVDNGYQAVLMAPTAILAEQHAHKIGKYGEKLGLKVGLI
ncbi:MAG: DEAD/DEAH box helicase, partial [Bacteroidota bacterium]